MKASMGLLFTFFSSIFLLSGPTVQRKEAREMATMSGPALPPMIKDRDYSISVACLFHYEGYYQFYIRMTNSQGVQLWNSGYTTSIYRAAESTRQLSATLPANLQAGNGMRLYFHVNCTSGSYAGYSYYRVRFFDPIESEQFIDRPDNSTSTGKRAVFIRPTTV